MPGDNIVDQHARRRRRQRRRRLRRPRRADVRGQGPLGERRRRSPPLNYDFWYQPRQNVLVSSEFGEPNAYESGFDLDDVAAGRYGSRLHFWDLAERRLEQTIDLGEQGLVPLEVRWLHDPDAEQGFVGAALSSTSGASTATTAPAAPSQVIAVDSDRARGLAVPGVPGPDHRPGRLDGRPLPVLLQLAARRPAPVRHLRSRQPAADRPAAGSAACWAGRATAAASSTAARRCSSSRSTGAGSTSPTRCTRPGTTSSTRACAPGCCASTARPTAAWRSTRDFFVDLHDRPDGPARAHEVRLQGGDCTTEIFQ